MEELTPTVDSSASESNHNFKSRNFCLLIYPDEDSTHISALEYIRSRFQYAAIRHDCDVWTDADEKHNSEHKAGTLKKPHWHIVARFSAPRWRSALAKELGISENYVQRCASFDGAMRYLVHADNPGEYQYDPESVEGPLKPILDKLLLQLSEDERIVKILDLLYSLDKKVTYYEFVKLVCAHGLFSDFRRSSVIWIKLLEEHNNQFAE